MVVIGIVVLAVALFVIFHETNQTGTASSNTQTVEITPLSQEEIQKFSQTILSTDFVKDLPENSPLAITFFDFESGQRRWRTSFLINNNGFLSEGNPDVIISMNSKYLSELNEDNLCEILSKANKAGDIGFSSNINKISLLIKYHDMLKHRDCLGI